MTRPRKLADRPASLNDLAVLGHLVEVLQVVRHERAHRQHGVCTNVHEFMWASHGVCGYSIIEYLAQDWPHATWSYCEYYDAEVRATYYDAEVLATYFVPDVPDCALWEGENLRLRLDLIEHCLRKVEADIIEMQARTEEHNAD